jgi:hypothetical protein
MRPLRLIMLAWSSTLLIFGNLSSASAAESYVPPADSSNLLSGIDFSKATPVDEAYRAEFKRCDDQNKFRRYTLSGWRKCSGDKNNVRALLKLQDGSIYFESKLGLDLDGSWKAWHNAGLADLRGTWYQWPRVCSPAERDRNGLCQREQVDAEHVPFIVIPIAGPNDVKTEFRDKTAIGKGDFGVIIYGNKWVPAFVADGGPYNKLGEGSAAALAALDQDRCRRHNAQGFCTGYSDVSIPHSVITIVFPGSRREGMTPQDATGLMCDAARTKLQLGGSPLCPNQ